MVLEKELILLEDVKDKMQDLEEVCQLGLNEDKLLYLEDYLN
jgi:hypothetical protein